MWAWIDPGFSKEDHRRGHWYCRGGCTPYSQFPLSPEWAYFAAGTRMGNISKSCDQALPSLSPSSLPLCAQWHIPYSPFSSFLPATVPIALWKGEMLQGHSYPTSSWHSWGLESARNSSSGGWWVPFHYVWFWAGKEHAGRPRREEELTHMLLPRAEPMPLQSLAGTAGASVKLLPPPSRSAGPMAGRGWDMPWRKKKDRERNCYFIWRLKNNCYSHNIDWKGSISTAPSGSAPGRLYIFNYLNNILIAWEDCLEIWLWYFIPFTFSQGPN